MGEVFDNDLWDFLNRPDPCPKCEGSGVIQDPDEDEPYEINCPDCRGYGEKEI